MYKVKIIILFIIYYLTEVSFCFEKKTKKKRNNVILIVYICTNNI